MTDKSVKFSFYRVNPCAVLPAVKFSYQSNKLYFAPHFQAGPGYGQGAEVCDATTAEFCSVAGNLKKNYV